MPKRALPSILAGVSSRCWGRPMSWYCDGDLSGTSEGSDCFAASAASSPKPAERPDAWDTTPEATVHSAAGTLQRAAAAATSIARALAPASRIGPHRSFTLDEPPVIMTPISRMVLAVIQAAMRWMTPCSSGWNGRPSTTPAMFW
jgi:hypothetical protein